MLPVTNLIVCAAMISAPPAEKGGPTDPERVFDELGINVPAGRFKPLSEEYAADEVPLSVVRKHPDKFPLRAGVLKAVDALAPARHLISDEVLLASELKDFREALSRIPGSGDYKDPSATRLRRKQETVALVVLGMEESLQELKGLAAARKAEPSKRWRAHYDFVLAETKFRLATATEFNLMYADIRTESLPALNPANGDNAWRLVAGETMRSRGWVRVFAEKSAKEFDTLASMHASTPWSSLAESAAKTPAGLRWEPFKLAIVE